MANQEEIKKRLTDILLRYNIYMDGVGTQGDHNHMADSLTLEVEKMLSEARALLEEASDLLSDAVDVTSYGRDAAGHFSIYKAEDWERRYRASR